MSSPYILGNWVAGEQFYGRDELCRAIAEAADRCAYVVGTRRVGKTSLLRRLAAELAPHAAYCDLMQAAGLGQAGGLDESRLIRLLRRELARLAERSPALAATREVWDRPGDLLCPWLEEAGWAWEDRGVSLTLLWDEAEMLGRLPQATLMCLRAIVQHSPGLRLVLAASKGLAALNDRWRDEGSPFLYGFRTYPLAGLDDTAAEALIRQRGRVRSAPEVAAALRAASGNHPYLLQLLCDRLYREGALREPGPADLAADEGLAELFAIDVARLSPGERAILDALAQRGPLVMAELCRATELPAELAEGLALGLSQVGHLRREGRRWAVGGRMLGGWLRGRGGAAPPTLSDRASLELSAAPATVGEEQLSEREREVLRLVAGGGRNGEIAARLIVSENTVKAHLKSIYRKLGASDRVQAINRARERGLLP